jgi:hypothetical protein
MSAAPLSAAHRAHLATSAIADAVIAERGYSSDARGLRLPIYQLGTPVAFDSWLRPDAPRVDEHGKLIKYLWPAGQPHVLDVLPRYAVQPDEQTPAPLYDRTVPLLITEGVKKQDALTSLGVAGVPVGLAGTWAWGKKNADGDMELLPDWSPLPLRDRPVVLIFDSDAWRKESVNMALTELAEQLTQRGARVHLAHLPDLADGAKAGVDDWIALGWTNEQIKATVTPWAGADDPTIQLSTLSATLRANNRKFAKLCGQLLKLDVGKQHMVKLTAIAHAHERLISRAHAGADTTIDSLSTRLCSKLGGTKGHGDRYTNYSSVNTAVQALQKMEIVRVDVAWNPTEGRKDSSATPGTYFYDPLNAPPPPKPEPRPKAVTVPTACSCGSDHTQISRVCHADGCADPVAMFYDGTAPPMREEHAIEEELTGLDSSANDQQTLQEVLCVKNTHSAPRPVVSPALHWDDRWTLQVKRPRDALAVAERQHTA